MRCHSAPGTLSTGTAAFTLVEVVISLSVGVLVFSGILYGYVVLANRAEWSAYSLAAHSVAMQGVEQARAAKWDPQAYPPVDELGLTNYSQVVTLDVPVTGGKPVLATNYVSVTSSSAYPPLRELRAECVWVLASRRGGGGPFTNQVITLRAADQ